MSYLAETMKKEVIEFNKQQKNNQLPKLRAGDIVRVHRKIKESGKERTQIFEGIIIAIKGKQSSSPMITIRKISSGVGVELILPVFSPIIAKIELVKRAKVRRSKLYYMRNKSVKSLRMKYKNINKTSEIKEEKDATVVETENNKKEKAEK